jgi:hypothetical protein
MTNSGLTNPNIYVYNRERKGKKPTPSLEVKKVQQKNLIAASA